MGQIDTERFEAAKSKIIGVDRVRPTIGTLAEKTVHAVLKDYYEPDEDHQEIPIDNYVADIYRDGEIMEIQTRQMNKMRGKLTVFLKNYPVTIVYPIPREKMLIWVDPDSGELSEPRRSPKKGNYYQAFIELYKIKMFLKDPNLRFKLVLLDMTEFKLLNGWSRDRKKGSVRYDRIPEALVEELDIRETRDYMQLVPADMLEEYDSAEFGRAAHIPRALAQTVLNILTEVGVVERVGKKGNTIIYRNAY